MNIDYPKPCDISGLRILWQEAFGDTDEFLDYFFSVAYSPDRALCVKQDGQVVGAMYWFECECRGIPTAYIYAVATAKEYRGKGICHKLMYQAHKILKSIGYRIAILVPSEKSLFEFYAKMGYGVCSNIHKWECAAKDLGVSVTEIDKDEYAYLRRQYLPEGGVIQERENIDFLAMQMNLYKGDGFVMAAKPHNGTLYCSELLGDTDNVSGIAYALNCSKGVFRTSGGTTPFAMQIRLDKTSLPPTYFGLAFD